MRPQYLIHGIYGYDDSIKLILKIDKLSIHMK